MYIHVLYKDGSPTVRYTPFFPLLIAAAISMAFFSQDSFNFAASFVMGNISCLTSVSFGIYIPTIDRATLGLFSLAVGVKMISAFFIKLTAFIVINSGSPGPHPTQ